MEDALNLSDAAASAKGTERFHKGFFCMKGDWERRKKMESGSDFKKAGGNGTERRNGAEKG